MKIFSLLLLLTTLNISAATKVLNSEVNFTAVGRPAFIKATGLLPIEEADFQIKEGLLSGSLIVHLTKLDSGIETRDEHLKEKYLEVAKYPEAKLTLKNIKLSTLGESSTITALLKLHGVEKEIPIEAKVNREGRKLKVDANFEVILTDFSIELPSFQGITAAKNVKIKVASQFEIQ